jgi:hypothetical protein
MNFKSCYRLCGVVINIFDSNTVYHWLYSQLGKTHANMFLQYEVIR